MEIHQEYSLCTHTDVVLTGTVKTAGGGCSEHWHHVIFVLFRTLSCSFRGRVHLRSKLSVEEQSWAGTADISVVARRTLPAVL